MDLIAFCTTKKTQLPCGSSGLFAYCSSPYQPTISHAHLIAAQQGGTMIAVTATRLRWVRAMAPSLSSSRHIWDIVSESIGSFTPTPTVRRALSHSRVSGYEVSGDKESHCVLTPSDHRSVKMVLSLSQSTPLTVFMALPRSPGASGSIGDLVPLPL